MPTPELGPLQSRRQFLIRFTGPFVPDASSFQSQLTLDLSKVLIMDRRMFEKITVSGIVTSAVPWKSEKSLNQEYTLLPMPYTTLTEPVAAKLAEIEAGNSKPAVLITPEAYDLGKTGTDTSKSLNFNARILGKGPRSTEYTETLLNDPNVRKVLETEADILSQLGNKLGIDPERNFQLIIAKYQNKVAVLMGIREDIDQSTQKMQSPFPLEPNAILLIKEGKLSVAAPTVKGGDVMVINGADTIPGSKTSWKENFSGVAMTDDFYLMSINTTGKPTDLLLYDAQKQTGFWNPLNAEQFPPVYAKNIREVRGMVIPTGERALVMNKRVYREQELRAMKRDLSIAPETTFAFPHIPQLLTLDQRGFSHPYGPVFLNLTKNPDSVGMLEDFFIDYLTYWVNRGAQVKTFGTRGAPLAEDNSGMRALVNRNTQNSRENVIGALQGKGTADLRVWINNMDVAKTYKLKSAISEEGMVDLAKLNEISFTLMPYVMGPYVNSTYMIYRGVSAFPLYKPNEQKLEIQVVIDRTNHLLFNAANTAAYPMRLFSLSWMFIAAPEAAVQNIGEDQSSTLNWLSREVGEGMYSYNLLANYAGIDQESFAKYNFNPAMWVPLFAAGPRHS